MADLDLDAGWIEREPLGCSVRVQVGTGSGLAAHPAGTVVLVVLADWTVADLHGLAAEAAGAAAAVLTMRHDGAMTVLGPVIGPGLPGCLDCAESGRLHTLELPAFTEPPRFGGSLPPTARPAVAAMIAEIAADPIAAGDTTWLLDAGDGTLSTHHVIPRPDCVRCHPTAADYGARFDPVPRPIPRPGPLRQDNPLTGGDRLRRLLVDRRFGPVVRLRPYEDPLPLPMVSAATIPGHHWEWSYGRGTTFAEAENIALFEAVERRSAVRPRAGRASFRAAYADLGPDRAVDPIRLGLPDPAYDHHPASTLTPYRPDLATRWVYGWSMTRRRRIAVPEHVAYYGIAGTPDAPRLVDETSNGCGLGNSLEEAVLHGLFEVAERDAFLMAWYARTPLRRVAVPSGDRVVPHLADRLEELGYELMFFDATNDLGLPVVLSLALFQGAGTESLHAYFAAGAHLDPVAALRSAALEAAVGLVAHTAAAADTPPDRSRLLRMLADPTEVRRIEDHLFLYTLPEARHRYEFLQDGKPLPWQEVWADPTPTPMDLTTVLTDLVGRLGDLGLETVVVDQTDPWTRERLGLYAAKVVVPGTLPMTFGHVHRRTNGLPRLLRVPNELGRLPAPSALADLPLHPHPFP